MPNKTAMSLRQRGEHSVSYIAVDDVEEKTSSMGHSLLSTQQLDVVSSALLGGGTSNNTF